MEVINPYLGKYSGASVFLNHGPYGPYLNYNKRLYSVPQCFQKPDFGLQDAIKIIEYKKKMKEQQIESRKDFQDNDIIKILDREPNGTSEDLDHIIKKVKSKKKF